VQAIISAAIQPPEPAREAPRLIVVMPTCFVEIIPLPPRFNPMNHERAPALFAMVSTRLNYRREAGCEGRKIEPPNDCKKMRQPPSANAGSGF
jgi:hypothetical protein